MSSLRNDDLFDLPIFTMFLPSGGGFVLEAASLKVSPQLMQRSLELSRHTRLGPVQLPSNALCFAELELKLSIKSARFSYTPAQGKTQCELKTLCL